MGFHGYTFLDPVSIDIGEFVLGYELILKVLAKMGEKVGRSGGELLKMVHLKSLRFGV